MAKVLKANISKTKIGMDDGTIFEVDTSLLNFIPNEGDQVEVFKSDDEVIINKISNKSEEEPIKRPEPITINNINNIDTSNTNTNTNNNYGSSNGAYVYGRRVNKIVYIIIAFLFGGIGGHKFYTGEIGKGIMYLLFVWTGIPSILALIAIIKALLQPADEYGYINV